MRLVVVGGGIAGLAAARAARATARTEGLALDVTLLEASDRLGGKVMTEPVDGVPLDWGPDSFLAVKPRGRELAEELGLGSDVVRTGPAAGRAYLVVGGDLRAMPAGLVMGVPARLSALVEAVRRGILSPLGALRAAVEPLVTKAMPREASAGTVARARLGPEAADRLVAPLVRAVFGAPADEVAAETAFPWATGRSSLRPSAAARPRSDGATFLGIRGGMGRLVDALVNDLDDVEMRTGCPAQSIDRGEGRYAVRAGGAVLEADAVILATTAPEAATLLRTVAPQASRSLASVDYSASAVVLMRFAHGTLGRPLDASGYVVAPDEEGVVTACSFLPAKWPNLRAPAGVWLRAVVTDSDALALPDEGLKHRVAIEVGATMRARGGAEPVLMRRWWRALPVYAPGHGRRIAAARAGLPRHIALAGAYVDGVGLPDCIRTGEEAARALVRALRLA